MKQTINVAFVGNPNCGKTTLFNAYTGANLKVANWPGVTVERKEGETDYRGQHIKLIDTPGIYSLTSYSIEEKVTRQCILEDDIDVIINIVDASAMERNLYLTMQLLELGKPVILALNMMDIVEERGMEIDMHRLPELLGHIPVVPVSARKRTGLDVLMHAVKHHYEEGPAGNVVVYRPDMEKRIVEVEKLLKSRYPQIKNIRWHAIKLLERDDEVEKQYSLDTAAVIDRSYEKDIINQKYDYIEEVIDECLFYKSEKAASTDKIDEVLTHRLWGVPIFLGIMALVFFLTFFIGDALKGVFEIVLSMFSDAVNHLLVSVSAADWLISLIVDGIIAGVGGILTFLPNIFILFLALAVLEDSGYMARVAYVMDKIMGRAGLSGKAFLPMILGFGCTVPAVMATRALEREEDRKKTILVTPFMSCSARLPIYVLFADMFFGKYAMAAAFSMYVLGMLTAIVIALVINRFQKNKSSQSLLIELPEYKAPNARTIMIYVWEKVKDYLTKAGTTIFVASIVIWFILNFNQHGMVTEVSESFGAALGRWFEPLLAPAGLGLWQIGVALISGLSAKEVVVSSFAVLFGVGNANSAAGMAQIVQNLSVYGFGALNAYALMVFCLLYTPCAATIGTIRKETHSWKFTFMMIAFQLLLAWGCAVLVFQAGSLLAGI
ncbi:ferrous iron transport protein B [Murimonas intestini]|uniref:Ferrous iron transport protein B n=1 Tax=Murimonas intestini TaxID=1337051 RepID=A0AB73T527_9FIRM|nr:ferrous iron transport protein B [Murimonas intestini]MCR1840729.1 ferrous iron transport protein B [Murimonas intestini]MCR1865219.1 ferrous iron transport protein B [Murimonas intestini]MCR1883070.1 ferrous iron transport protein B [Murimonas intestini]